MRSTNLERDLGRVLVQRRADRRRRDRRVVEFRLEVAEHLRQQWIATLPSSERLTELHVLAHQTRQRLQMEISEA